MKFGYARVSTVEQNLAVQLEQLKAAGCDPIYQEKVSGQYASRPQLQRLLKQLRPRDLVVVTKLDRLARNTADLLDLVAQISAQDAGFTSLSEPWADTSSPAGTLIITVMAGIAQFERSRMIERCNEGRAMAKRNGVKFGRKPALSAVQAQHAAKLLQGGSRPNEVAGVLNVGLSTIYRFKRTLNS